MKYLYLFLVCMIAAPVWAQQEEQCGTGLMLQEAMKDSAKAASIQQAKYKVEQYLRNATSRDNTDTIITIPVVVHVIHTGQAIGTSANISDTQVISQIQVLNASFNYKKNTSDTFLIHGEFKERVADVRIKFCLAEFDDSGHVTSGITRDSFATINSNAMENGIKQLTQWAPTKYLNIWTTDLGLNILGYTNPLTGSPDNRDGVVVNYRYFGKTPASQFTDKFNLGKTAVHEVGHWLNLYHVFDGGCVSMTDTTCDKEGDFICDTPPAASSSSSAKCSSSPNKLQNSCHESPLDEPDMWENYMDYSCDKFLLMFTNGQKARMRAVLNTVRQSIQYSTAADSCKKGLGMGVDVTDALADEIQFSVYPNPTTGIVTVQYWEGNAAPIQLQVLDIMGRRLFETAVTNPGRQLIDLSSQSNGIYFIKVQGRNSEKTLKISILR